MTVARYILTLLLTRFALVLVVLSASVLLFDMLANAADVLAYQDRVLAPLIAYLLLRLPSVLILLLPLASLIAAALTVLGLGRSRELLAIRQGGVSALGLFGVLSIGALVAALAHLLIAEFAAPPAAAALRLWQEQDYRAPPPSPQPPPPEWLARDTVVMRLGPVSIDGHRIQGIEVFGRSQSGSVHDYLAADQAVFDPEIRLWRLQNALIKRADAATAERLPQAAEDLGITPEQLARMPQEAEEFSLRGLIRFLGADQIGSLPDQVYALWAQRKLAAPFGSVVMAAIVLPLALRFSRTGSGYIPLAVTLLAGFCFILADRFLVGLGEAGSLPPLLAVWTAPLVFMTAGIWAISREA